MLQWASIEIVCACVIANAAFFQAVFLDFKGGSGKHSAVSTTMDSSLDERRPSRRPDLDDEENIGIWKSTSYGAEAREYEHRAASSLATPSRSISEQRLVA